MLELKVDGDSFRNGLNSTCVLGLFWTHYVGKIVDITDISGKPIRESITIKYAIVKPFMYIVDEDLTFATNPNCRTWDGLLKEMRNKYGVFDLTSLSTILFFEIT